MIRNLFAGFCGFLLTLMLLAGDGESFGPLLGTEYVLHPARYALSNEREAIEGR